MISKRKKQLYSQVDDDSFSTKSADVSSLWIRPTQFQPQARPVAAIYLWLVPAHIISSIAEQQSHRRNSHQCRSSPLLWKHQRNHTRVRLPIQLRTHWNQLCSKSRDRVKAPASPSALHAAQHKGAGRGDKSLVQRGPITFSPPSPSVPFQFYFPFNAHASPSRASREGRAAQPRSGAFTWREKPGARRPARAAALAPKRCREPRRLRSPSRGGREPQVGAPRRVRGARADVWPFTHLERKTHRPQQNHRPPGRAPPPDGAALPRRPQPGDPAGAEGKEGKGGGGGGLTSGTAPGAAAWVRAARPGRALGGGSGREAAGGSWGGEGRSPGPHWRAGRRGAERRPKPSVGEEREPGGRAAALTALRAPRSPPGPRLGPPPAPGPPRAEPGWGGTMAGGHGGSGGAEPRSAAPQALCALRFTRRSWALRVCQCKQADLLNYRSGKGPSVREAGCWCWAPALPRCTAAANPAALFLPPAVCHWGIPICSHPTAVQARVMWREWRNGVENVSIR